ncbi:four-helix bundle copper-binding protein [Streptomyces sp. NBC_01244]|uniref:four-helix bundle copper-binding protein n=1 Tax=Streptomyces sp. NBC_01244 TaxID=2903797 RepID=UPI002E134C90|nr:four-helix bundle copper-binding protein [Streptomyces sp. NBC_01244]
MSSTVKDMLATYPADLGDIDQAKLTRCIEECIACAQACTACADACLSEGMVSELAKCIRTDMDCAATAAVLSRHTGYDADITAAILKACAMVSTSCADECGRHADMHEHCRICVEACRSCEQACNKLLGTLG